jgi:spermidine synthase
MKPLKRFSRPDQFASFLVCLSAGSGCAALIYEIVWFQLLEFVIGSSAASIGVLLGAFMGGMCLGSILLPRLIKAQRHPLWVYAIIELGIGGIGILILFLIPLVATLYAPYALQGIPEILLRAVIGASLLLPPTVLMGATLPAIARWMDTSSKGISRLGGIYAANIAGAVFGCLLAGFYLLRLHDTATATYVAAGINGTVALAAATLAAITSYDAPADERALATSPAASGLWSVYVTIALSGLTALGAEVIWTRVLASLFGASVYAFSIILAVFLFGLGIGSSVGSYLVREGKDPRTALGACQLLLVIGIAWAAFMIGSSLPYWPIDPSLASSPWYNFQIDLFSCAVAVMPATLCWGASFPFALAAAIRSNDAGKATAAIYAANTVGAIVGALGFSMILFPEFGAQRAEQCLIAISAAASLSILAPKLRSLLAESADPHVGHAVTIPVAMKIVALAIGAAFLIWYVPDIPGRLIAGGRELLRGQTAKVIYQGNGRVSSVAVSDFNSIRYFHVSGKIEASNNLKDMRLQRLLGHISALLNPKPRSVLVVGFGAGVTAGTFTLYPEIERIVICEIEPIIPPNVGPLFSEENYDVLHDPRVTVVYDDARHYMLTSKEKFDVITSDPIHPWVKGSAALYTKEYFQLAKKHLNPGGVVTQWVPLYETNTATVKSEIATFFKVFPGGVVWGNDLALDVILSGQVTPTTINLDESSNRYRRPDYKRVTKSLVEVKISSLIDLLSTYVTRQKDLGPWLANAEINTDRNLRLQYIAAFGRNMKEERDIYRTLLSFRKFPPELFTGSQANIEALSQAINAPPKIQ